MDYNPPGIHHQVLIRGKADRTFQEYFVEGLVGRSDRKRPVEIRQGANTEVVESRTAVDRERTGRIAP